MRSLSTRPSLVVLLAFGLLVVMSGVAAAQPYSAEITTGNPFTISESAHDCNDPGNLFTNCGFETGDLTGWIVSDLTTPFLAVQVSGAGATPGFGLFATAPTEGAMVAVHGWDGDGPGTIEIAQDVIIGGTGTATLDFDYRAGGDLLTFGATLDRPFDVVVQPAGGGAALATIPVTSLISGVNLPDSGPQTATLDLSPYTGQDLRVVFAFGVPEFNSGPAFFQLDNVQLTFEEQVNALAIPTLSPIGIVLLGLALAALAMFVIRRREQTT